MCTRMTLLPKLKGPTSMDYSTGHRGGDLNNNTVTTIAATLDPQGKVARRLNITPADRRDSRSLVAGPWSRSGTSLCSQTTVNRITKPFERPAQRGTTGGRGSTSSVIEARNKAGPAILAISRLDEKTVVVVKRIIRVLLAKRPDCPAT